MSPRCNIDARGKRVRLVYGALLLLTGLILLAAWAIPSGHWVPWTVSALCIAGGALGLYGARAGWCAMRAMGFRTPM